MPEKKAAHGGPRAGSGPKTALLRLTLSQESSEQLRLLARLERTVRSKPELTEEMIVEEMIAAKWRAIEAHYQKAAEIQEPYII